MALMQVYINPRFYLLDPSQIEVTYKLLASRTKDCYFQLLLRALMPKSNFRYGMVAGVAMETSRPSVFEKEIQ